MALALAIGKDENTGNDVEFVERTIVFTDIVRSTEFADRNGDLDIVAASFAGEVVKGVGDGSMIVFADPHDAVAAAIELQRLAIRADIPLRVGADYGLVAPFRNDYIGLVANVAARLTNLANEHEILLSQRVADAANLPGRCRPRAVRGLAVRTKVRSICVREGRS